MDIRHIKITSTEGLYRINEKKAFKGLIVSLPSSSDHNLIPLTRRNTLKHLHCEMQSTLFPLKSHLTAVSRFVHSSPRPPSLGDDSVLPAELFKGVLQGGGHHAAYAFQTTRGEQLA